MINKIKFFFCFAVKSTEKWKLSLEKYWHKRIEPEKKKRKWEKWLCCDIIRRHKKKCKKPPSGILCFGFREREE